MMPRPIMASVFWRKKYQVLRYWSSRGFGLRCRRGGRTLESKASLTPFSRQSTTHGSLFMYSAVSELSEPEIPGDSDRFDSTIDPEP
jgi:hypothetical protein